MWPFRFLILLFELKLATSPWKMLIHGQLGVILFQKFIDKNLTVSNSQSNRSDLADDVRNRHQVLQSSSFDGMNGAVRSSLRLRQLQ